MNPTKTKKTFDALEFKNRIQSQVYQETRDMSPAEQIAYFARKAKAGRLGKWWKKVRKASVK